MKSITRWLETRFSQPRKKNVVSNQTLRRAMAKPHNVATGDYRIDMSFGHVLTEPDLKILDQSSLDANASSGFNPYDTVHLHDKYRSKKL